MEKEKLIQHLSDMIRIPTVSSFEGEEDPAVFEHFRNYLKETYPRLHEAGSPKLIGKSGLLFTLPGQSSDRPSVLMAHYDVVPADPAAWEKDPFSGEISDTVIYGRGAIDTKCTLCAILEACEAHLAAGSAFKNDVYLAFSGEEEVEGTSSAQMASFLKERGIRAEFVLDEGGAVIPEGLPFLPGTAAMVGIAEKGVANVRLTLKGRSGHASVPPKHTTLGRLARAAEAIEDHPFPAKLTEPVREMFRYIGSRKGGAVGFACRNIGLFSLPVSLLASQMGGTFSAMVRTTCAVTMMEGSPSYNILPDRATLGVNLRVLPGDTLDQALAYLKKVIRDPEISIELVSGGGPSPVSKAEGEPWQRLVDTVKDIWPSAMTAPYTLNGGTDSRAWHCLSDHVFKFTPLVMGADDRAMVHGVNEQIRISSFLETAAFYEKLAERL